MGKHEVHLLRLLPLLRQVLKRVGAHRTQAAADLGLTNSQFGVLVSVYRNDNCTMGELAGDRFIALPAATRIVDGLVKKNLIERAVNGADRRVVRLKITQQGRKVVERVHKEAPVLLARVLEKMSAEEQKALLVGLEAFVRAVMQVDE